MFAYIMQDDTTNTLIRIIVFWTSHGPYGNKATIRRFYGSNIIFIKFTEIIWVLYTRPHQIGTFEYKTLNTLIDLDEWN